MSSADPRDPLQSASSSPTTTSIICAPGRTCRAGFSHGDARTTVAKPPRSASSVRPPVRRARPGSAGACAGGPGADDGGDAGCRRTGRQGSGEDGCSRAAPAALRHSADVRETNSRLQGRKRSTILRLGEYAGSEIFTHDPDIPVSKRGLLIVGQKRASPFLAECFRCITELFVNFEIPGAYHNARVARHSSTTQIARHPV
jgi:hypothetical protein